MKTKVSLQLSAALLCFFLSSLPVLAASPKDFHILVTVPGKSHEILRVSPNNKIKLVKSLPTDPVESTLEGSTAPLLSPDGKKLAFLKGDNLHVQDFPVGKPLKVTKEGFTKSQKYHSVFPLISGWSRDSKQLLYYLKHTEPGMEGEEEGPALEPKDLRYGYYFYAPPEGVVELPGLEGFNFCGWTSKNEGLFLSPNQVLLYAVKTQGRPREIIFKYEGCDGASQVAPGPKNKALAVASSNKDKWSQVVELDLTDGTVKPYSAQKGWADFNFPVYSPTAKKTAWVETERNDDGTLARFLTVDRNAILDLKTAPRFEWVDEGRIAVVQMDKEGKLELLIVSSATGETLARKGF